MSCGRWNSLDLDPLLVPNRDGTTSFLREHSCHTQRFALVNYIESDKGLFACECEEVLVLAHRDPVGLEF